MTTATAQIGASERGAVHYGSISRGRKRTLYWSYFFLILFVIFFLMPPIYMFITSLKTSAEIGAVTNPWWVYHPTLQNYIDLLSQAQFLTKIFIPVALPGIIAATIFTFTVSWANFLYPLAFTTSADQLVLPVGIVTTLIKGDVYNWGQIMTGALLGAAPPLIIYAFLMDYYIAGLTAGA